jgi:FdhD protein
MTAAKNYVVERIEPAGTGAGQRNFPVEAAIAIEFNGIGYAIMMATPVDLCDFGAGFALSEKIVDDISEIEDVACQENEFGWTVRIQVPADRMNFVTERARNRLSESGCGLCGIESLERIAAPLPVLPVGAPPSSEALFAALAALAEHQPINRDTGGVHAAAFCSLAGEIRLVREDVGRHNALDKVIGALALSGTSLNDGFLLLTSRCSYELVEKAVRAGCPTLVTVSTATTLAIERADAAHLRLIVLARSDAMLRLTAISPKASHPKESFDERE